VSRVNWIRMDDSVAQDLPLYARSAGALAAMIRGGEVSAREVIEAHLARIEATNPRINAAAVVLGEEALTAADRVDRGAAFGPLAGVPFTVKESIDCVGSATTNGVPALRSRLPFLDAPAVARLRAAGAIPIARGNMSELGIRLCTDNPLRGPTLNPHDPALTAGGSSGGDAAAVAVGMAPFALGSDLGGSLRVPAGASRVAALKPTRGRVARASSLEPQDFGLGAQLMWTEGPIARTVGDLRRVLGLIAGRDVRDPGSVDAPLTGPPPEERCAALVTRVPGDALPPAVEGAIRRAGALLEAAGWEVVEVEAPELVRVADLWLALAAPDLEVMVERAAPILSPEVKAHVRRVSRRAARFPISPYTLHAERSRLGRVWSRFLTNHAVAIGPNWSAPLWPAGADLDPRRGLAMLEQAVWFTLPGNALGLPAVTLPAGVQIYADLWREDLCLEVAELLEGGFGAPGVVDPASRPGATSPGGR
jgi:amidase